MVDTFSTWQAVIFGARLGLASKELVNELQDLYAFTDSGLFEIAVPYLMADLSDFRGYQSRYIYKYPRWGGVSHR